VVNRQSLSASFSHTARAASSTLSLTLPHQSSILILPPRRFAFP
jgi:hypothetical protein